MEKIRGFEVAKGFEDKGINLPVRKTKFSAGYDVEAAEDGNPDNDGHIMFAFYNIKDEDIEIKKGDCIGQAIFQKYLIADNDSAEGERKGGFGSTNQ